FVFHCSFISDSCSPHPCHTDDFPGGCNQLHDSCWYAPVASEKRIIAIRNNPMVPSTRALISRSDRESLSAMKNLYSCGTSSSPAWGLNFSRNLRNAESKSGLVPETMMRPVAWVC